MNAADLCDEEDAALVHGVALVTARAIVREAELRENEQKRHLDPSEHYYLR